MKKIKIMLLSLLVVGAVGGAVAFKANKTLTLYCGTTTNSCPTPIPDLKTTDFGKGIPGTYCTTVGIPSTSCTFSVTTDN